jgi:hypothetical protein
VGQLLGEAESLPAARRQVRMDGHGGENYPRATQVTNAARYGRSLRCRAR